MPAKERSEKSKTKSNKLKNKSLRFWKNVAFVLLAVFIFSKLFSVKIKPNFDFWSLLAVKTNKPGQDSQVTQTTQTVNTSELQSKVIPAEGVELPIDWGNIGKKMVADGVIDEAKFRDLFKGRLDSEEELMLNGGSNQRIVMTQVNSQFVLDMLWAFGLANRNPILTEGEMTDAKYGGDASQYASTGGWSLSRGDVMSHYSKYPYIELTDEQQAVVDRVSSGIYRPCCGNSTHFPDCNHGMAMLGLLELMAANGVTEEKMYEVALKVNSYWFPQTYLELATYFKEQGQDWEDVDPKIALGAEYSSGQGYAQTRQKIKTLPTPASGGGGCGV